ncbi:bifunctional riboflavin kinase/FAD synthetase [Caulobacter sp. S45]|uniref:bifunctional riboflavin kinase/FAD synthetase n=1 Tax=Caulobacter sp. S45 TaxID=1641861 RepID=UPI001575DE44|nr:bifunctional riboflavin kinase/FAD synthetase [Caulobacter sp. S45]
MALHIVNGWRGLEPDQRGGAVALGNFDGVHCGHRQVIADAARASAALHAPLAVVSFEPHPRRWFQPDAEPFRLLTPDQLGRVLADLGVERLHLLAFDAELASLTDEAFAREVLAGGLGARHVAAGFDISFGAGRTGDPQSLRRYGERFGFGVSIAEPVSAADGGKCSSSAVRRALHEGDPRQAARLLGRPFAIEGVVVHGDQLGRTIGFPTANISLEDYVRPLFGIYAARTRLADGREIPGVAYVGRRPTVDGVDERLEVHLFDFDEDLYGQTLEVELTDLIRGDRKFDSLDAMIHQMAFDANRARELLMPPF